MFARTCGIWDTLQANANAADLAPRDDAQGAIELPSRPMLSLVVNGESMTTAEGSTVASLVADLGLDVRQIAVEHNREIIPRKAYPDTQLADGDLLEIVTFVGGGL